jgi:WD40 repeat protein
MARRYGFLLLTVWSALTLPRTVPAQPTNRTEATAVLFRPDGKTLISTGLDGQIRTWDVATGRELGKVQAHREGVFGAALSADGKVLATAGADRMVCLWDATTLKPLRELEGHKQEVVAVAFSPDGKTLASGGADRSIRLWDVGTGKQIRLFHAHELKVTGLAFSPDGKLLASGGMATAVIPGFFIGAVHADEVRLWDPATGKEVRKLAVRGSAVAFAPDGQTVAGGGMFIGGMPVAGGRGVTVQGGGRVGLSDPAGKELLLIKGQGGAMAFSLDGKFFVTAWGTRQHLGRFQFENDTRHRRVALWEVASRKEVLTLGEDGAIVVAVSPDGKKAAAGRFNGSVGFLDLAPPGWPAGKRAGELTPEEFDRRWQALAAENVATAYEALWVLVEAGDRAALLLSGQLEAAKPSGPRVGQLLKNLDSKRFAVRESAFRELKKLGPDIEPDLREAMAGRISPEVRKRLQLLLDQYGSHPATPEEMRQTRALQVLERVGSRQARAVLTRLAEGAPAAWLTREARDTLRRLEQRPQQSP